MSFKTILVHAEPTTASAARLKTAAALARTFGAALHGVGAVQFAPFVDPMSGYVDPALVQMFEDQLRTDLREAAASFEAIAKDSGVDHVWRGFAEYRTPAEVVIDQARAADLVVVTCSEGQLQRGFADPADILMGAGLPVLALPAETESLQVDGIVVAWKNTREARRAITDAMPFLQGARRVVLAAVVEADDEAEIAAQLDDVRDRLRGHGVSAEVDLSPRLAMSVADQIAGVAESQGADLIVAGAYGHARAREWLFGGVTQGLLRSSPKPVLFSR
jgi:nucleotide-binding universal stress UspA family protein